MLWSENKTITVRSCWECVSVLGLVSLPPVQYDAPVITALKDTMRTLREKISVVFVCERRDVMVDALTYFLLSSLVVTVLLLPEKHTETKSAQFICDYKTFSRFVCRRVCSAEETYLCFFYFTFLMAVQSSRMSMSLNM